MPTYQRAPQEVIELANALLCEFATHKPLLDAKVKIDLVFAFPNYDDNGQPTNDALKHHGRKVLGLARRMGLKDRAMGRGDAEISLDAEWWGRASEPERRALLDHELHHLEVRTDVRGIAHDDLGRPKLLLRKHDVDVGWFSLIADRHGEASLERRQAAEIAEAFGQFFWPALIK